MQSHVRLGVFSENPRNHPGAKVLKKVDPEMFSFWVNNIFVN